MEKIVNTVSAIILNPNNELLLQKKDLGYPWFPGQWCLFGGGIEDNESYESTFKRELLEELNYEFTDYHFYKKSSFEDKCHLGIRRGEQIFYVARLKENRPKLAISEGSGIAFFDIIELENIKVVKHDLDGIMDYYSEHGLLK